MSFGEEAIESLRAALEISPDNAPLRLHLAQTLSSLGRHEEAEPELRKALATNPNNTKLKLELALNYSRQNKTSQAIVILEDLGRGGSPPPESLVLHAQLLLREGDVENAVIKYKHALELDPTCEDSELTERLGVTTDEQAAEIFEGRVRESYDDTGGDLDTEIERPKITFKEVGGMDELKEEIGLKIIYPMNHPEMYAAYGKSIGGGIMMYGPPGCGKTYLARATAGEIKASFISVGISDVLDMWIGSSERKLSDIFQQARRNTPCVLFFDEVDALGAKRSDLRGGGGRQMINQFLSEMDGVEKSNEGVLVLAATNAPWHVDPAFRRPGRFDRVLFVPPPDQNARAAVLQLQLHEKPTENIDYQHLAKKTDKFSGADLKAVVDQAIEAKLRQAMKEGIPRPLTTKDLIAAAKSLKPTTREWFSTARNYAIYSNEGGVYDDVLKYLK